MPQPPAAPTIDADLVTGLIADQFSEWSHLSVTPVVPGGVDNRTFRLGTDLSVRLPSAAGYVEQVAKEQRWLPELAPQLPVPIPRPVAVGRPGSAFPWPWSVYRWMPGVPASVEVIDDLKTFAVDLAAFLVDLRAIDANGGPLPGTHNFQRGGPPAFYDAETRSAIETLGDSVDGRAASRVWDAALESSWSSPPVWFHGDISHGNLLVQDGRLAAVIDFGTSGIGDPSCDLVIAWTLFDDAGSAYSDAASTSMTTPGLAREDGRSGRRSSWRRSIGGASAGTSRCG